MSGWSGCTATIDVRCGPAQVFAYAGGSCFCCFG